MCLFLPNCLFCLTKKRLLCRVFITTNLTTKESSAMIPVSRLFDQTTLATLLDLDPVVQDYRQFFALLDWSLVEQWERQQSLHRRPPLHPESAYIKAFLVRIREGFMYSTQLRRFLLKHPLLIIELGFHLELDPLAPYGFDAHKT